jgi:hypothetical protein
MTEEITNAEYQQIKDALKTAQAKIDSLEGDNYNYRSKLRELKAELATAKAAVPPEGAIVLTGDDAKAWEELKALGSAADLQGKLDKLNEAENKLRQLERTEKLRGVADAAGYDFDVLAALSGDLEFEVTTKDGEEVVIVLTDAGSTPIADYAESNWSKFLPALAPDGSTATGKRIPPQHSADTGKRKQKTGESDVLAEFLAQREAARKPNPLIPKE